MPEIKKDDMSQDDLSVAGKLNPQMLGSRKRPKPVQKSQAIYSKGDSPERYHPDMDRYRPRLRYYDEPDKTADIGVAPPVCGVRGRY